MLLGGLLEEKPSGGDMEGNLDMGFIPRDQHWRTLQLLQPTHNVGSELPTGQREMETQRGHKTISKRRNVNFEVSKDLDFEKENLKSGVMIQKPRIKGTFLKSDLTPFLGFLFFM